MQRSTRRTYLGIVAGAATTTLAGCSTIRGASVTAEVSGSPPWITTENVEADPEGDYVSVTGDLTFEPDDEDWQGRFRFQTISYNEHDEEIDRATTRRSEALEVEPGETKAFEARTYASADEAERVALEVWDQNGFRDCDLCGVPR